MAFDTGNRPPRDHEDHGDGGTREDGAVDDAVAVVITHSGYDEELGLGDPPMVTDPECVQLTEIIDRLTDQDPAELIGGGATQADGDAATLTRLRDVSVVIDRLEAHRMRVLRAAEETGVLQRDSYANASVWLRRDTNLSAPDAARRAKVARRMQRLPHIAAALAAGRIGVAHASLIDRLATDVGLDNVEAIQHPLIVVAQQLRDVKEFRVLCDGWRHALAPDALDDRDKKNWDSRRAGFNVIDGRGHLWGDFDAQASALIATAIDALTTFDGPEVPPDARRTRAQRVADAITDMARRVLDAGEAPITGRQRPHVNLNISADTLAGADGSPPAWLDWIGPVGRATALRVFGDCSLTRIVWGPRSQPLDVGTATRMWPAGIAKVIAVRDGACRFPGCDRGPTWCDIDHVEEVNDGGATAVDNGILLCGPHHDLKQLDQYWPTLHPDGRVTWTHPTDRTRVTHPAARIHQLTQMLLDYPAHDGKPDFGDGHASPKTPDSGGDTTTDGHEPSIEAHDRVPASPTPANNGHGTDRHGRDDAEDDHRHPDEQTDDQAGEQHAIYNSHGFTAGHHSTARRQPGTATARRERRPLTNGPSRAAAGPRPPPRPP